jgi:hypothetical protein
LNKAESEPEPELMIVATRPWIPFPKPREFSPLKAFGRRIRPTNGDELPQLKA